MMKELMREADNKLSNFQNVDMAQIMDISAGGKHSMVLSGNGCLYTFGFGEQGQLGHKNSDNQKKPTFVKEFDGIRL